MARPLSVPTSRTAGDFMTCMAMCGNGVWTGTETCRLAILLIPKAWIQGVLVSIVEVHLIAGHRGAVQLGVTILVIAVL